MHGCWAGMHGSLGGHAWLLRGGMRGCSRGEGVCMVFARGGMCGFCQGGHVWFLPQGEGACMVFPGGHAWFFPGGWHAWFFWGGVPRIRRDTVNERAVRILLECILVPFSKLKKSTKKASIH